MHRFIRAERANHSVATLCRVLGVSRAGSYAASRRPPCKRVQEDKAITEVIAEIHADSRETYGAPRVQAMLARREIHVARKRVARLMRSRGLSGPGQAQAGQDHGLGPRDRHHCRPGPTRSPTEPSRLWVADITYCRSWEGWLYLEAVLDCHSRKVVGWSLRNDLRAELVADGIERWRSPAGAPRSG